MAYSDYERLSALDMSFLSLEDRNTHMHIGAAAVFEVARIELDRPLAAPAGAAW